MLEFFKAFMPKLSRLT